MKKNYVILSALLFSSMAFGQSATNSLSVGKHQMIQEVSPSTVNRAKATFYTNDFSTPGDWAFQTNGVDNHNWVIGTTAPSGGFPIDPIASTTAANGFALFDSDLLCGTDQNADVYLVTPVDLSGQPSVQVTFESYYRDFNGECYVIASTDGVNWDQYEVHAGVAVNTTTANPALVSANVSATVGNSATAYIGFRYVGVCDYAWMVDDVQIETLPDNDVAMNNVWAGDIINDWDYTMMPDEQISTMTILAAVGNNGALAQNNVPVVLTINMGATQVYTETINADFAVAALDTIVFNTTYTPSTLGEYTITVTVPADDVTGNEVASTTYSTTNNVFAHDFVGTSVYRFDVDEERTMGNIYTMNVDQELTAVQVEFETGTTVGTEVAIAVWQIGADIRDLTQIHLQYYEIPAAQIGPGITTNVVLTTPRNLVAGESYLIDVRKSLGPDRVFFGGSAKGNDDNATVCYGQFAAPDPANYYYITGFSPAIRANFDQTLSINEANVLEGITVYPNPSEGLVTITNDFNKSNTITVTDLTGKVVTSKVASTSTTIDLSTAGTGVYLVQIENENGKKVERVVIK